MRNLIFIIAVFIGLLFGTSSCRVDEWTKFSLFYPSDSELVATSDTNYNGTSISQLVEVDFKDDIKRHGAKDKQVEEVLIERLELHIIKPETANFTFLDKVSVFLIAEGLDTLRIAEDDKLFEQSDGKKIRVPIITDRDIEEYLRKPSIRFMLRYLHKDSLPDPLQFKFNMKIRVDSRRFGI